MSEQGWKKNEVSLSVAFNLEKNTTCKYHILWTIRHNKILEDKFSEKMFYSHLKHLQTIRYRGVLYNIFQGKKCVLWSEKYSAMKNNNFMLPDTPHNDTYDVI